MNWTELLESELDNAYKAAEGLISMVDDDSLDWKPASGDNWMTTGQLLNHIATACGGPTKGFVTGDWGMPAGADAGEMAPEEMLPPAESLPGAESVAATLEALAADKALAREMIAQAEGRMDEPVAAPWDPRPRPLGQQVLGMIEHLNNHKAQLFYYLKLQGAPVNTWHFYGMA